MGCEITPPPTRVLRDQARRAPPVPLSCVLPTHPTPALLALEPILSGADRSGRGWDKGPANLSSQGKACQVCSGWGAGDRVGFPVGPFPGADTCPGCNGLILLLSQIAPSALTGCPGDKGWHQAPAVQGGRHKGSGPKGGVDGSEKPAPLPISLSQGLKLPPARAWLTRTSLPPEHRNLAPQVDGREGSLLGGARGKDGADLGV